MRSGVFRPGKNYFNRVLEETGTEFWCNNPTSKEIEKAYSSGAVGITTNPGYFKKIYGRDRTYLESIIVSCLKENSSSGIGDCCFEVMKRLTSKPLKTFKRLYVKIRGRSGLVAIQGDPSKNDDTDKMKSEVEDFKRLGENIIIKVPATEKGAEVLEMLTIQGFSTICTMCFTAAQYIFMADTFEKGLKKSRSADKPQCYITVLPGLLKEYFKDYIGDAGIDLAEKELDMASLQTVKVIYDIYKKQNYNARIISGGARGIKDWTGILGKDMAITIGWDLAEKILNKSPNIEETIGEEYGQEIITRSRSLLPELQAAIVVDGLKIGQIRDYPPFRLMQERFIDSYSFLKERVEKIAGNK